jgi:hypothetical protein
MNIFVLDEDVEVCARYHCDAHIRKMIIEYAQLLSFAFYSVPEIGAAFYDYGLIYKNSKAHFNHPCAVWVRESLANWEWLQQLAIHLSLEHWYRYGQYSGNFHKSGVMLNNMPTPEHLPNKELTEQPKCMPDQFKDETVITSYRNYYRYDKVRFATWKNRSIPYFMKIQ